MKRKILIISLCFVLLLVCIGSIFLYRKATSPTILLQVGIPNFDSEGNITSIWLDAVLDNRQDTDTILLAMINARRIDPPAVTEELPDAIMMISYQAMGFQYQIWFLEDSVIIGTDPNYQVEYRMIYNDHTEVVSLLKKLVNNIKY
ncbi:MAG: hypothetical protein IKK72_06745 [Oscillospiraceae bacterium]|nr:hypothetical protein [Oscillospiraceae bacterium]